ncbi:MAG TPA: BMP family ABC transporter substrate-binding protein [Burkholderiaceae bacterium]|nr:BMP family ABC transporter substrate-binding protein [Burkholderiaceae bacterium]
MTDAPKRSLLKLASWSALAAAAALVGCGKKEEAPAASAAAPASAAAASAPAKAEPLKIAFAYLGPAGDHGWTYAHDNARKAIEKEFGDKIVVSTVENVPESADAERIFRDMASQGNKLIFGTSFGYMEPMLKVAEEFKDAKFEHATGYKQTENLRSYDSRSYMGAYMVGIIAGKMTKTNTLGVVGSIAVPEVVRNINAYTLGAQSVNPKIKTKVVWVGSWFDPPKETEAAQSLINSGADVLLQNTDSTAVLQTAEKNKKYAFGWDSDMSKFGPEAHLASAIINWTPYYTKAVKDALEGTWKGNSATWWGVKEGANDVVSISDKVPADVKELIAKTKAGLADGSIEVFKGPLTGQDGKEMLKADTKPDDKFMGGMLFYVKGVEGKVPSGK